MYAYYKKISNKKITAYLNKSLLRFCKTTKGEYLQWKMLYMKESWKTDEYLRVSV